MEWIVPAVQIALYIFCFAMGLRAHRHEKKKWRTVESKVEPDPFAEWRKLQAEHRRFVADDKAGWQRQFDELVEANHQREIQLRNEKCEKEGHPGRDYFHRCPNCGEQRLPITWSPECSCDWVEVKDPRRTTGRRYLSELYMNCPVHGVPGYNGMGPIGKPAPQKVRR